MVQLDGSEHDWFEGRRGRAVLMVMVDDATSCTDVEFFEGETTHASYDTLERWMQLYGTPGSVYVDKDSIYRCERAASVAEQMAGQAPRTQFGRAMDQLGVEPILAHSPQAKGRVERRNGMLQDRLVKALRLEGISDLAGANEFLRRKFWPEFNRKFQVKPRSPADAHARAPRNLDEILSWQEERVVSNDWRVQWKGQSYQIGREEEALGLPGRKVMLRRRRNGQVEAFFKGRKLKIKILPEGAPARLIVLPGAALPLVACSGLLSCRPFGAWPAARVNGQLDGMRNCASRVCNLDSRKRIGNDECACPVGCCEFASGARGATRPTSSGRFDRLVEVFF
jgi:hypothetical protein